MVIHGNDRSTACGFMLLDKPQGITSHDVVAAVRKAVGTKRVGHAGTLDPMATGLLIVAVGQATRLLGYVMGHDKAYLATIRLGIRTTTEDVEGEVIEHDDDAVEKANSIIEGLSRKNVQALFDNDFTGQIMQTPSTYSAIKIDGQRAYDLARRGRDVHLSPRVVRIVAISILDMGMPFSLKAGGRERRVLDIRVRVVCSAGTYIRALARDIGEFLGVGAHLTSLRRTEIGPFRLENPQVTGMHVESHQAINRTGDSVVRAKGILNTSKDELSQRILPMAMVASLIMPTLCITQDQAKDLRFGRRIVCPAKQKSAAILSGSQQVVAIVEPEDDGVVRPEAVFASN